MADNQLAVETREGTGKGRARQLRAAGRIPAICYSPTSEPTPVSINPTALERLLATSSAGINTLIDIHGGGLDGKLVLIKELQRDPVRGTLVHADLYAVDLEKAIIVSVPIHVTGTAIGIQEGGIVDHALREIDVSCLPRAIPEQLDVDVSELALGMSIHVRDFTLPEGAELVSDPDLSVVSVVSPAKLEEEVPAEVEEGLEGVEGAEGGEGEGEGGDEAAAPAEENSGDK